MKCDTRRPFNDFLIKFHSSTDYLIKIIITLIKDSSNFIFVMHHHEESSV